MKQETSGSAGLLAAIVNSSFDAIISKTLEGTVTSWNPAATKLFGYDPGEMVGKSIRRLIPPDRQDEEDQILAKISAGEQIESYETVRLHKNGHPIDVFLTSSPIWGPDGTIIGASKIVRDITSQKKAAETLRKREEVLSQFVEQACAALAMFDRDMRYMACSRRWLTDHGLEEQDVVGRSHYEVFPDIPDRWKEAHRRGMAGEVLRAEEDPFVRADGRTQWERWGLRPWLNGDGSVGGIIILAEDVTERVEAVRALRENELRMRLAQEAAKAGTWEWRLADNRSKWSENTWRLYGLKPGECAACYEAWVSSIHPEDRKRATTALREAVEIGDEYETQWRVNLPEGEPTRWLFSRGRPIRGANGDVERYIGVVIDITERKQAEEALRESELRTRLAQQAAKAGTWQWSIPDDSTQWSENFWSLCGLDPRQYEPCFDSWASSIHPADREHVTKAFSEAVANGEGYEGQWRANMPEGEPERWLFSRGSPIMGANGVPERYIGVVIDITERKRMEEALRKAEELERQKREELETILAAMPAAVIIAKDADCTEMAGNRSAYDLLRLAPSEDLSKSAPAERAPHNFEVFANGRRLTPEEMPIQRAAASKTAIIGEEVEIRFVEGDSKFALVNALPLFDDKGQVRGAVGAFADVTELKRTEAALRESEKRLQFALEAANAGTWEESETGEHVSSDRALSFLGFAPGTVVTHDIALARVHPEDRPSLEESLRHTFKTGKPYWLEWRALLPDGSIRWLESRGERRSVSGTQVVSGLVQDITERRRAEQTLREREELLAAIIEHVPVPLILWREDRKVLLLNPAVTKLTGYTAADIPSRDEWEALAYRDDDPHGMEDFNQTFERGRPVDLGDRWVHTKYGEKRLWSLTRAPAGQDASGRRLIVGVANDITERRRSDEDARAARSTLEAALAGMRDAVFIADREGRFIHLNEAFARFHKFKSKNECAKTWAEYPTFLDIFLPNGELAPLEEWPFRRALRGENVTQAEYALHRKDTGELWVGSYNFAPIRSDDDEIIGAVVTARDITDQKASERRLRESEARLSSIIDTAADSIIVIDEKGVIQSANSATEGIFGYCLKDLIGQNIGMLMAPSLAAQHDRFLKDFSGRGGIREIEGRRKDGSSIPVDVAVAEWRDGEGCRFFTGILRDLTERKRNEEALANARRLEAVGQLAGGVAHDFNNLLHVISGNLEIAQDYIEDETTRSFLERARSAVEKGSALNGRLLSLARRRTLKLERLNLNDRVQETAKLLASTVGEHISVATDLATSLWMTLADPGEIDSAILNLAANARDAMPGGGNIQISTSNVTLDAAAAKQHPEAAPGDYVRLAIADNGLGMPEDILDKATEAFFTTKGPGVGTGLGLTSVASFASHAGGFMSLESAPGQGCTVSIYLPRTTRGSAARGVLPGGSPLGRGQLILVVEDDAEVREVTRKRLEALGYTTTEASTGPEALERLTSQEGVRLVLSDIVMPGGMTGYDVARWVASNKPDVKVIMCSGYNDGDQDIDAKHEGNGVVILGKPFTRDQLARALSDAFVP